MGISSNKKFEGHIYNLKCAFLARTYNAGQLFGAFPTFVRFDDLRNNQQTLNAKWGQKMKPDLIFMFQRFRNCTNTTSLSHSPLPHTTPTAQPSDPHQPYNCYKNVLFFLIYSQT